MASCSELALCAALVLFACPSLVFADKLHISSTPPGATVELDGVSSGTTPLEKEFPGGYFHKTRTSMGAWLEHPVVARVSLAGYATKELTLTEGPMNWISLNGRNRGEYWLFKSDHFDVELKAISETFTGGIIAKVSDSTVALAHELSLEELVRQSKPAVVYLKGLGKSGSGFFVTGTGVIVTNAHLARGEETLHTLLSTGRELEGKVVYIDADLDIALVKVAPTPAESELPHLTLADASTVHQGESVIAIGNPGEAMLFSVEKASSVSASNPSAGQSLDSHAIPNAPLSAAPEAVGTVSITSDPDGTEIFGADKFHGNTPATLKLPAGSHAVVLKFPGHADWRRALEILKSSKKSLKAVLDPAS